ncbi:hypothetical protein LHEJCM1062_18410 [Lactobacillus helveticus]|uniref:Uncharacterized protein n=1 Tax=Lactobacillus helveticus TaxID=1587 RepID=A0AAV4E8P0_LACHE|nr:hypothetical protein [Lactobacillus helveticus]GFP10273.1 hypothetical protein LHEJCM1007_03820 [Lactobacillus helveticus]GFP13969.1 hypothetical protein LHEJCM1062_18410 [Lactobacillus helveticus]
MSIKYFNESKPDFYVIIKLLEKLSWNPTGKHEEYQMILKNNSKKFSSEFLVPGIL